MSEHYDFSGLWKSSYVFKSSTRAGEFEKVHYVKMHLKGNQLVVESLPDQDDAYMIARFSLDGRVATGSWQEHMAKHDYYEGKVYHGAAQLVLDADGNALRGKWVGFGENMVVNTGKWEIVRTDEDAPEKTVSTKVRSAS